PRRCHHFLQRLPKIAWTANPRRVKTCDTGPWLQIARLPSRPRALAGDRSAGWLLVCQRDPVPPQATPRHRFAREDGPRHARQYLSTNLRCDDPRWEPCERLARGTHPVL